MAKQSQLPDKELFEALEKKLLKAKIELMTKSVFISSICLSVKQIITRQVKTAATNDLNIFYNPEFILPLTVSQLCGLIAHECWHIAFQHLFRRGSRDPFLWNVAGDYVINNFLVSAAFELPTGGLVDSKYDGMSTEEVYEEVIKDPPPQHPDFMLDIGGDSLGDPEKEAQVKDQLRDILVRANTQSHMSGKAAGEIPGEIARAIDEMLNPKLPWEVILQRFADQFAKVNYDWRRRNRRHEVYLPSMGGKAIGHLFYAMDTSGSMTDEQEKQILGELQAIRDRLTPEKMTIIDCDSVIQNVYEIDMNTDLLSLKFTGGGGTRFTPVLEYCTERGATALVYFTDLYGESQLPDVDYPVLWICDSEHEPSPLGETIYLNS